MFNQLKLKPLRIRIPFLIDVIFVSDPVQIRLIEKSGTVDRLHSYPTKSLPWWVKLYFSSTKFHDKQRDLWFCPFESKDNSSYYPRRAYLEEKVALSYSQEDVQKIAELLRTDAEDEVLAHAMVQIVNRRFFDQDVPLEITREAKDTVQSLPEALLPWKYIRGKKAQAKIMNYCQGNLPQGVHILDVGHNIGEVVQASALSLKKLKENLDQPIERTFTDHAPTPQVPRIAIKASTFDGMLRSPTTPGKTVLLLMIAKAAAEIQDLSFTFSTGSSERECVFKDFFLKFMADLQQELKQGAL
ncbi:hypothetical protein NIES22_16060 [Calothrix brevissima NIES-22]|nr:hypothetical protein NIES22_16060 [Calothrix brevissima NIES-22]